MDMNSIGEQYHKQYCKKEYKKKEERKRKKRTTRPTCLHTQNTAFFFCQLPVLTFEYNTTRVNK